MNTNKNILRIFLILFSFLFSQVRAMAEVQFEYPELQVVPKASQRVEMEARKDRGSLFALSPLLIPGAVTLSAGIMQFKNVDASKDADKYSPMTGVVVGGGWIAASLIISQIYSPYISGYNAIAKLPASNKSEQLVRERLAEEAIYDAQALGRKLSWLCFASNAFASIYMMQKSQKETISTVTNLLALLTSFTPFVFQTKWQKIGDDHESYKKKIYGPLAFNFMIYNQKENKIDPGLLMKLTF